MDGKEEAVPSHRWTETETENERIQRPSLLGGGGEGEGERKKGEGGKEGRTQQNRDLTEFHLQSTHSTHVHTTFTATEDSMGGREDRGEEGRKFVFLGSTFIPKSH